MSKGSRTKTAKFTKQGIKQLPKNKPVVYKLKDGAGSNVYTGIAKRGRVEDRLKEHLPGSKDAIPGVKTVQVTQQNSIAQAERSESRIISQSKPKRNTKGK